MIANLKDDSVLPDLTGAAIVAWIIIIFIFKHYGYTATMSSAKDGQHGITSLHFSGNAFDVSTKHIPLQIQLLIFAAIRKALNVHYDVIHEPRKNHIHIEYQPRGNLIFK